MRQKTIDKIRALTRVNGKGVIAEIEALLDLEERAEQMAEDTQELLFLANVVSSYMDMTPKHPLYVHVGRDVRASLRRLFDKKEED